MSEAPRSRAPQTRLTAYRAFAARLGPVVERGALQHFFVSPVLPEEPLSPTDIRAAWADLAAGETAGRPAEERVSLYLHVPFCRRKCSYCIYYSVGDYDPAALQAYLERLHREMSFYGEALQGTGVSTVYLGGGTPTELSEAQLEGLLSHLDATFTRRPGGEWAFEVNPLSITPGKAARFADHGFNRVSFGVQSFSAKALAAVNRGEQTPTAVEAAVRTLREHRFWINVDLIHGLPGESPARVAEDVARLLDLGVTQVTVYQLSPYTPDSALAVAPPERISLPELAAHLEPVTARARGARLKVLSTSLGIEAAPAVAADTRLLAERGSAGEFVPYDDTTIAPVSLLGIGPTARAYVYGRLSYRHDAYPVTATFAPDRPVARGRAVTLLEERRRFAVYGLSRTAGLVEAEYRARFGEALEVAFATPLSELDELGLLQRQDGVVRLVPEAPAERFAAAMFFVDETMIAAATADLDRRESPRASSPPPPVAPHRDLVLEAEPGVVVVRLVERQPGRAAFGSAGPFAFFEPDGASPGAPEPVREALLQAFARLFRRVALEEAPPDLAALAARLVARGRRLRLARRSGKAGLELTVTIRPRLDV